ncbi:hypothetical protein HBI12_005870 [Parastagonospora nodorum]|nr:hypothetical protein HBI12_005870 [Parastagonospora nodorum]
MIHDWTESLPKTDHVRFFKTVDWTQTVLGETQQWSVALRMYTQMVMSDTRAACLYCTRRKCTPRTLVAATLGAMDSRGLTV